MVIFPAPDNLPTAADCLHRFLRFPGIIAIHPPQSEQDIRCLFESCDHRNKKQQERANSVNKENCVCVVEKGSM